MEGNNQEYEMEPFFILDIYYLEESKSAEEFYHRLGEMIYDVPKYDEQELKYLSELVSKPFKKKKGRPSNDHRDIEIRTIYYQLSEADQEPKTKKEFIEIIMNEFRLDFDASRKAIKKAFGTSGNFSENKDIGDLLE